MNKLYTTTPQQMEVMELEYCNKLVSYVQPRRVDRRDCGQFQLTTSFVDNAIELPAQFFTSRVCDKVSDETTLIFGNTRIYLEASMPKNNSTRLAILVELRLVTSRHRYKAVAQRRAVQTESGTQNNTTLTNRPAFISACRRGVKVLARLAGEMSVSHAGPTASSSSSSSASPAVAAS